MRREQIHNILEYKSCSNIFMFDNVYEVVRIENYVDIT